MGCLGQSYQLGVLLWQLTDQSEPKVLQSNLTLLSAHSSGTCMVLIQSKLPFLQPYSHSSAYH